MRDALLVDGIERAQRGRVFGFHRTMDTLGAVIGPLLGLAGYELFSVVNFPDALLLLRLKQIGFSVVGVILAYVGYNAVYAVTSFPAGVLADRFGRPVTYGVGLVFFAVGYLGLGITTDTAVAWGLIVVYGLFTACYDGVGKAWISTLVGTELQSNAQGIYQGLSGFAVLAAGLWAGFLWGADGRLPLLISGVVGAAFAVVLLGAAIRR